MALNAFNVIHILKTLHFFGSLSVRSYNESFNNSVV